MEVILGKKAGFCPGVKNTVIKAKKYLAIKKEIYCLGQLVHNSLVVEKLAERGMKIVESINNVPQNANLITRAHGISKEIYAEIRKKNINLMDLTCPKVLQIHKQVEEYAKRNYYIILIAEKKHPETEGTYSFAGENVSIIEKLEDISIAVKEIVRKNIRNIAVFAQTTFSMEKFDKYIKIIRKTIPKESNLEINKTICDSTKLRQIETTQISKQVELMLVLGSKKSANTNKLYEIAEKESRNAMIIETMDDLYLNYIRRFKKVGVVAGASTPQEMIDEVVEILKNTETEGYI